MNMDLESLLDFSQQRNWIKSAIDFDVSKLESMLSAESEKFWIHAGEKRALHIFHQATTRVPAYKNFLEKNKIDHKKILNIKDFQRVPLIDKKNYINAYPIEDRCWDGKLSDSKILALSSGTSGEPVFWPRSGFQEFEATIIHELLYKYLFDIDKHKTLLIVGFPMGIYVSGVATLLPSWIIGQKYNISIASVGTNRNDFIRIISSLQDKYEQVVIAGHPFFIKDVIELGKEMKISWQKNLKMMFCSEGFSEAWREYLINITGTKNKPFSIISTYGTAELLLIGHETISSIKLKQKIEKNNNLKKKILGGNFCSGIFQYNPLLRYIETINNELIFTSASGIPLIRYNLHDTGQIISAKEVVEDFGIKDIKWKLPFLALGNKSDYTIIFYAANIYPDHIKQALDKKEFLKISTGRFVMRKFYTKNMEEKLEINVELNKNIKTTKDLENLFQDQVIKTLKKVNTEYLNNISYSKKDMKPVIKLWEYQDEKFFKSGLKPKYISSV